MRLRRSVPVSALSIRVGDKWKAPMLCKRLSTGRPGTPQLQQQQRQPQHRLLLLHLLPHILLIRMLLLLIIPLLTPRIIRILLLLLPLLQPLLLLLLLLKHKRAGYNGKGLRGISLFVGRYVSRCLRSGGLICSMVVATRTACTGLHMACIIRVSPCDRPDSPPLGW